MAALSSGHCAVDFAGGALYVMIPYLHDEFDLSYTLAAVLVLCAAISGSVVQPLFGLWSDRHGAIWLIPAGVAAGGIGMALAGVAPSYGLVVACVIVSGLGTAAFHPEGSKFAAYVSGRRRASGMSLFSIGGNLGFGLGALAAALLVHALGLHGALLLAVPCLLVAAVLLGLRGYLLGFVPDRETRARVAGEDDIRSLVLLLIVITFRSLAWYGVLTFVPLWEVSLGHSKSYGTALLWSMLLIGGIGTLAAGPIADRIGLRTVLLAANVAICPMMLVFVLVGGAAGAIALARGRDRRDRDVRDHDGDGAAVPAVADRDRIRALDRLLDRPRRRCGGLPRRDRRLDRPPHRARRSARPRRSSPSRSTLMLPRERVRRLEPEVAVT